MSTNADSLVVENNEAAQRFETTVEGLRSVVEYRRRGNTIIFTHTEVPETLAGRGIANKLAQTALDYARAQQLAVIPLCPFVASYIRRHTAYQDLVAPEYR